MYLFTVVILNYILNIQPWARIPIIQLNTIGKQPAKYRIAIHPLDPLPGTGSKPVKQTSRSLRFVIMESQKLFAICYAFERERNIERRGNTKATPSSQPLDSTECSVVCYCFALFASKINTLPTVPRLKAWGEEWNEPRSWLCNGGWNLAKRGVQTKILKCLSSVLVYVVILFLFFFLSPWCPRLIARVWATECSIGKRDLWRNVDWMQKGTNNDVYCFFFVPLGYPTRLKLDRRDCHVCTCPSGFCLVWK